VGRRGFWANPLGRILFYRLLMEALLSSSAKSVGRVIGQGEREREREREKERERERERERRY
jgi:hypothetical protein